MFRKNIEPSCMYCRHGREIGGGEIACIKTGVVSITFACRRFSYDPFKREPIPPQRLHTEKLKAEDFEL